MIVVKSVEMYEVPPATARVVVYQATSRLVVKRGNVIVVVLDNWYGGRMKRHGGEQ